MTMKVKRKSEVQIFAPIESFYGNWERKFAKLKIRVFAKQI